METPDSYRLASLLLLDLALNSVHTHPAELLALNVFSKRDQTSCSPTTQPRFSVSTKIVQYPITVRLDSQPLIARPLNSDYVLLLVPQVVAQSIARLCTVMVGLAMELNA